MAELRTYRPDELIPWPGLNPRTHFDEAPLAELEASIAAQGIRQPLAVHARDELPHWIVAGERRWRAATRCGADVPAMVGTYTEAEALDVALIENLQRADMTPLDEARAFRRRLELGDITQAELAEKIGLDPSTVANRIRLLVLPDGVLELIDLGALLPSHARDYLLPFANIPQAKWSKLTKEVEKALRHQASGLFAKDGVLRAEEVERTVARTARELSRPLSHSDVLYGEEGPLFPAKAHKDCGCGGPSASYGYGGKSVRCFDDAWWNAAQRAAEEAEKEAERKASEKLAGATAANRVMSAAKFREKYGWGGGFKVEMPSDQYGAPQFFDPSELAGAAMVLVNDDHGGGRTLYCVDDSAVRRAKSAATKLRNQMLKERRDVRAQEDLATVAKMSIEPWMLRQILKARPQNDALLAVSREIGIDIGKHGETYDGVLKLGDRDTETFFKVLALRSKQKRLSFSSYGNPDPIEKEVDGILRKKYGPGVRSLQQAAKPSANGEERGRERRRAAARRGPSRSLSMPERTSIEQRGDECIVRAPFSEAFVEAVKSMPVGERRWDRNRSVWIVSAKRRASIEQLLVRLFGSYTIFGADGEPDVFVDHNGRAIQERLL